MFVFFLLCAAALCHRSRVRYWQQRNTTAPSLSDAGELWFDGQLVDHFDQTNTDTWSQRYFVNTTHFEAGGPVFLMIGGEGPESQRAVNGRFHYMEWAAELHGIGVALEHRYYGKSYPTDFSTSNLRFLSASQALNDLAVFRDWFAKEYACTDSDWIVVGGSYSGNLAAWARQEYPHLFVGAIASSAPVLAQVDFPEYLAVVEGAVPAQCAADIKEAFVQVDRMVESAQGRQDLQRLFNTCPDKAIGTSYNDVANFLTLITDPVAGVVQYASADGKDIHIMCQTITNPANGATALERYGSFIQGEYKGECFDPSFKAWIAALTNTDTSEKNLDASSRAWFFQTCAEYGYYQTGTASIFSDKLGLPYFRDTCLEAYGLDFPNVAHINGRFGARNTGATNTFFANGAVDPWHVLGVQATANEGDTVVLMEPTSHCYDLYVTAPNDPPIVDEVKEMERQAVLGWLGL